MKILWSPDFTLAGRAMNVMNPQVLRSLEGDDLHSYCAARLVADEIEVFRPGSLAALSEQVEFDRDGVPMMDHKLMKDFSGFLLYFGALQRIYEANPNAISVLLHDPASIPSDIVASYVSGSREPAEQREVHQRLVDFLNMVVDSLPASERNAPFFFTGNELLGRLYLEAQKELTAENTLSLLATSGITFALPRVGALSEEGLSAVNEALKEEREKYLETLNKVIGESYSALRSGDVAEAYRFAQFSVNTKIQTEASKMERAVRDLNKSMLKRLKIQFIDGLPALAKAASSGSATGSGIQLLSMLTGALSTKMKERSLAEEYPLGSYVYRIRRDLEPARIP